MMPLVLTGDGAVGPLSATEVGFLDGVTSSVQSQINTKANDASLGLYFIASQSFSASTAVNVNNCFSSTYLSYRIIISFTASAANALLARLRVSGVDDSGANYDRQAISGYGVTVAASQNNATTSFALGQGGTSRISLSTVDIYNPQVAASTSYVANCILPGSNSQLDLYGGFHTLSTSYDGFSLITSTGTVTGTVRVYGYRNS